MSENNRRFHPAIGVGLILATLFLVALAGDDPRVGRESQVDSASSEYAERPIDRPMTHATLEEQTCAEAEQAWDSDAHQRDKRDLCAQFRNTLAAEKAAGLAAVQTLIGGVGLIAVLVTLLFNIAATDAATRAAEIANKQYIASSRPHFLMSEVQVQRMQEVVAGAALNDPVAGPDARKAKIAYRFENFGKGIGTVIEDSSACHIAPKDDPLPERIPMTRRRLNLTLAESGMFEMTLKQSAGVTAERRTFERIQSGDLTLYVALGVRYRAIGQGPYRFRSLWQYVPEQHRFIPHSDEAHWYDIDESEQEQSKSLTQRLMLVWRALTQ